MPAASPSTQESKCDHLTAYLRRQADEGEFYFKSKFIAPEVDLSAKEIGALLPKIRELNPDLQIDQWAYTNATTWRVVSRETDDGNN